jgi:hypothetical protein
MNINQQQHHHGSLEVSTNKNCELALAWLGYDDTIFVGFALGVETDAELVG